MAPNSSEEIAQPFDRTGFRRRLRLAVLLPATLTGCLALVLLWQLFNLMQDYRAIQASDDVMGRIPVLLSTWIEMETSLSHYLGSGDLNELAEYEQARDVVDAELAELEQSVAGRSEVADELALISQFQAEYAVLALADLERGPASPGVVGVPPDAVGAPPGPQGPPPDAAAGLPPPGLPRVHYVPRMARQMAAFTTAEQAVRQERRDAAIAATRRLVLGALGATILLGAGGTLFGRRQLLTVSGDYERALELARSQEAELRRMATHDALTGLPNRRLFRERLDAALAAGEESGAKTAVLYVDLDGFKEINDRLGHTAGDQLLVAVAQRLTMSVRPDDTIARMGGDEFTVLATELANGDEAEVIAKAPRASLGSPFVVDGESIVVSASIGVALATGASPDADALMRRSDGALYQAKAGGKSRYVVGAD